MNLRKRPQSRARGRCALSEALGQPRLEDGWQEAGTWV